MRTSWLSLCLALVLSACNTIEGVGRDLGAAGDAVAGTASSTKEKMR